MIVDDLVERLLASPDATAQDQLLQQNRTMLDEGLAARLKAEADQRLRIDARQSLAVAELMARMARWSHDRAAQALALLAQANAANIGLARYVDSLTLYDQATAIYREQNRPVQAANAQIGKLYALANLGRYEEAMDVGGKAADVLLEHHEWLSAAKMIVNLAITHGRRGDDLAALNLFDRALALYVKIGLEESDYTARMQFSRAIVLRNLGRFKESMAASEQAITLSGLGNQRVDQARARQSLAITYFVLGRYNEALGMLYQVRSVFSADGRQRDVLLVDLFISDCLLHLRRFSDVLDKLHEVQTHFEGLGSQLEVAQALLNQARAYGELQQTDEALRSLAAARTRFEAEGNHPGMLNADLQQARLLLRQGQPEASSARALTCAEAFQQATLPFPAAEARLVAARALLALGDSGAAQVQVQQVAQLMAHADMPDLAYQVRHLQGKLALQADDQTAAFAAYNAAIENLERVCGRLMIEHRPDFLQDKDAIYGEMIFLCLDLQQPAVGLRYVERAKSRALQDLLSYRIDLSIHARSSADAVLIDELTRLRGERDRLCRRRESREDIEGHIDGKTSGQILSLEKRITELWHELLVRNADYARDASLWTVHTEDIGQQLDREMILVEYFVANQRLIVFTADCNRIEAHVLPTEMPVIQQLATKLWLNLRATPRSRGNQIAALVANARTLLYSLYRALIEPVAHRLAGHRKVIIAPHSSLHYLPFHAFYDGARYLLEQYEFSYLPGASFLRYSLQDAAPARGAAAVFGYTWQGRLPRAASEAEAVAALLHGRAWVEDQATLPALRAAAADARLLHLATHGDFRPDNPLFSGLRLADGALTTLDVFNLHLQCSLVTLSACQTGQSVVGGGDELLGLMRAFLYAGASSLALALWPIEDEATAYLMKTFYTQLTQGAAKGAALRNAQLQVLHAQDEMPAPSLWSHPYYWAAFFLVGHHGKL